MSKRLMLGNEAAALGAYLAGVKVAAAYPGTPSTEIMVNLVKYEGVYAEWSPNEKVALEVASGASLAGRRALAAMKHVGLNVAADPFFTLGLTGVNGGLVVICADDPGMHSSQNEQDNRYYARAAKVPMLEPADSQETVEMLIEAYRISEEFDVVVLFRMTTRVSHSRTIVDIAKDRVEVAYPYEKDAAKYVMVPGHARARHVIALERLGRLEEFAETCALNRIEGQGKTGIITSGVSYQYVREVFTDARILKLGLTYPIPSGLIKSFADECEQLYVVEELEPYLEDQIKALGIEVVGKDLLQRNGELNQTIVREAFGRSGPEAIEIKTKVNLPARPPVMCPGCPHRGLYYALVKLKLTVTGDIGCYTLGALPPLSGLDTCLCMGASIGQSHGFEKADPNAHGKVVSLIGDSTFVHSGITGLINIVYNRGASTTIISDNRTTAMTGQQDHPGTGKTLSGEPTHMLDFEVLARAIGVNSVRVIDPADVSNTIKVIEEEVARDEPSLIIARRPCVLLVRQKEADVFIDAGTCNGCKLCLKVGCPSISLVEDKAVIDEQTCTGCGVCVFACRRDAITAGGES